MCCFSQPVRSVSQTRVFGRLTNHKSQFVAYQMQYKSDTANAMILPIPVRKDANEDSIRFLDLSSYPEFFDDLERGFSVEPSLAQADSVQSLSRSAKEVLKVHKVGGFEASFVPTASHFSNLDPRFSIAKNIWDKIPKYADYGFVVFRLHKIAGEPHPMAFEFDSRITDAAFLPTVHIHDGEVHQQEDFDHALYIQHPEMDEAAGDYQGHKLWDLSTAWVRSKGAAGNYVDVDRAAKLVDGNLLLHRKIMKGKHANEDQIIEPRRLRYGSVGSVPYLAPSALALGGIGLGSAWFLRRRTQVMAAAASSVK